MGAVEGKLLLGDYLQTGGDEEEFGRQCLSQFFQDFYSSSRRK